jgi:UDP-N-acetylglucosamine:LPS N-acetylglucosamine transferase
MKVGLVCSAGGHLAQLYRLRAWWGRIERFWVTFDKVDARELLAGERVHFAHGPTNRNAANLIRNALLARRLLARERPDVLVSNGAGLAVPFFAWGAVLGIPLVYVEVPDRIDAPSLTTRLVRPLVDRLVLSGVPP